MELTKIEALLVKYEDGNTTLAEEKILQDFFTTGDVPFHLEEYKTLFSFTSKARTASYPKKVRVVSPKRNYFFVGIAASFILAIGIFAYENDRQEELQQHNLGTIEDPEEAYLKAKETLQLISTVLNNGQEELTYVQEFDKVKNKYIKQ